MNLEITDALRAYFTDQAFRNAIDGLMPRIDGAKAIQAEKFNEYREFNDALLTAAQVRHDLIAFLISACEVSYLEAVEKYKWHIDWDSLSPSEVSKKTFFSIFVKPETQEPFQFELGIELNLPEGTLTLNGNYYNESKDKYLDVNITQKQANLSGLKVESDDHEDNPTNILSSKNFVLSENLARPDDFAKELAKVGTKIVSLMIG